jgi:hypothetical protein
LPISIIPIAKEASATHSRSNPFVQPRRNTVKIPTSVAIRAITVRNTAAPLRARLNAAITFAVPANNALVREDACPPASLIAGSTTVNRDSDVEVRAAHAWRRRRSIAAVTPASQGMFAEARTAASARTRQIAEMAHRVPIGKSARGTASTVLLKTPSTVARTFATPVASAAVAIPVSI